MIGDLKYSWRGLRHSPLFTLVAVLTLGLGIGANVALFSVVDAVLLRRLPFPEPDGLVRVVSTVRGTLDGAVSPPDYADWRRMARSFTDVAAMNTGGSMALSGDGPAEQVPSAQVTDGFLRVMGVSPALGRTFSTDEMEPGAGKAVLVSDALWRRRFGADSTLVGRTIRLDGAPYLVAGVMPRGFTYPAGADLWMPLAFDAQALATQRGAHYLEVVARLAPGVRLEDAAREMTAVAERIRQDNPTVNLEWSATVQGLRDSLVGDVRRPLFILLGAVGVVLLIACVNVANLLLARGTGRAREHAVRLALGASSGRLASLVMAESVWLGLAGAVVGVALASWSTDVLVALAPSGVPGLDTARVDLRVMAVALAAGLATSLLFGLLPALRAGRGVALADRLRDGGAALGGRHGRRSRQGLVVTEVALAVILVIGAGLLLRSFARLRAVDPGFDARGVLTFAVSLPDGYGQPRTAAFYQELEARARALPGVSATGAIFGLPLTDFGYGITIMDIDGRPLSSSEQENGVVPQVRVVTPGYFATLGITPVRGRVFSGEDREGAPPVVVLSESAARRIWSGEDPLGRHLTLGTRLGLGREHQRVGGQVIGVVPDLRDVSLAREPRPVLYVVHDQFRVGFMSMLVRSSGDPALLTNPLQAAVASLDPDVPMFRVRTMDEWVGASLAPQRFYALLIGLFALLALGLAAVGVYGVLAQAVGERTREIGLRVALGAAPREVVAMVVRQGIAPVLVGLGLGLALALGISRLLQTMLFEVRPQDLPTYGGVTVLIASVGLLAAWIPARRAARVDPLVALRND